MKHLTPVLALAVSACAANPPAAPVASEAQHRYCLNRMYSARLPHTPPTWAVYDYCVRQGNKPASAG